MLMDIWWIFHDRLWQLQNHIFILFSFLFSVINPLKRCKSTISLLSNLFQSSFVIFMYYFILLDIDFYFLRYSIDDLLKLGHRWDLINCPRKYTFICFQSLLLKHVLLANYFTLFTIIRYYLILSSIINYYSLLFTFICMWILMSYCKDKIIQS